MRVADTPQTWNAWIEQHNNTGTQTHDKGWVPAGRPRARSIGRSFVSGGQQAGMGHYYFPMRQVYIYFPFISQS